MNRPARKLQDLERKLAAKIARSTRKNGRKTKQWKKNVEQFKPLAG
ncbi:MAG: hypothetical protein U0271_36605 [Polyangiaceae bacterium]